jgi:hypothetical protein
MKLRVQRVVYISLDLVGFLLHELAQLPLDLIHLLNLVEFRDHLQPHVRPGVEPIALVRLRSAWLERVRAPDPVAHVFHELEGRLHFLSEESRSKLEPLIHKRFGTEEGLGKSVRFQEVRLYYDGDVR